MNKDVSKDTVSAYVVRLLCQCAISIPTGIVGAAVSGAIAGPAARSKGDYIVQEPVA